MNDRGLHSWFRARMAAFATGLLGPAEEERFREHRQQCAECRTAFHAMGASDVSAQGLGQHLPAELVARWSEARRSLRGLERSLVRNHLARCEECRQDLQVLGHAPELEVNPELEEGFEPTASRATFERDSQAEELDDLDSSVDPMRGPSAERPQYVIRLVPVRPRPTHAWLRWALGGWAAAATAAAAVLLLFPGVVKTSRKQPPLSGGPVAVQPPTLGPGGSIPGAPAPAEPRPGQQVVQLPPPNTVLSGGPPPGGLGWSGSLPMGTSAGKLVADVLLEPLELRAVHPGEALDSIPTLTMPASTRIVPLHLSAIPKGRGILAQVLSLAGDTLQSAQLDPIQLRRSGTILLFGGGVPRSGRYILRLETQPGPASDLRRPETIEYPFRLRIEDQ
ncbi:MAG: hypothetical protein A2W29_13480 [Gemmatimonadetes bacterium RBG_16_66_8]|nr:MAG: hypothetical protein A2W29_13480 [Gemmatimonadetes bacterium RBG_16_66_8]